MRIIGALWQYIKSNRLQDSDNRELVNCNSELVEIFGEDKFEFHNAIFKLKEHLYEVQPLELTIEIKPHTLKEGQEEEGARVQRHFYDLPLFEHHTRS